MKLRELITRSDRIIGSKNPIITGIEIDSRKVVPGTLFAALSGTGSDGHHFLKSAVENGAAAILIRDDYSGPLPETVIIRSPDPRISLSGVSDRFFGSPSAGMNVIGVTGTNGKTTTTFMIENMLRTVGISSGLIGTIGCRYGNTLCETAATTPESPELHRLLSEMIGCGVKTVAMEVSSHSLDWRRVDDIRFDVGVFTNLTQDHLDFHQDMSRYFEAKKRLFALMTDRTGDDRTATAILNRDDPRSESIESYIGSKCRVFTFGTTENADVFASGITLSATGSRFQVKTPWGSFPIMLNIPGRHNILNSLAAFASTCALGYPPESLANAMSSLAPIPGRMETINSGQPFSIIVDYAHTPDALENLLGSLKPLVTGRLIVVFGCGGDRDRRKRPLMGDAVSRMADLAIITSDNPRTEDPLSIIDDILPGMISGTTFKVIPDRLQAIEKSIGIARDDDVVVIAGKGHETYQIIGSEIHDFDDRKQAVIALRQAGYMG